MTCTAVAVQQTVDRTRPLGWWRMGGLKPGSSSNSGILFSRSPTRAFRTQVRYGRIRGIGGSFEMRIPDPCDQDAPGWSDASRVLLLASRGAVTDLGAIGLVTDGAPIRLTPAGLVHPLLTMIRSPVTTSGSIATTVSA
jgi:hypothetical protein